MKKLALCLGISAALVIVSTPAVAQSGATMALSTGKMLYYSDGKRIGSIYRVTSEGNPQIIMNGNLITVPASSLSDANGKITTSLSKADLGHAH